MAAPNRGDFICQSKENSDQSYMQKVGNFFMPKDPKQAVVTAKPVDEKRERVNMRYQRRSENEEETDEENGDSARVRSELERKTPIISK